MTVGLQGKGAGLCEGPFSWASAALTLVLSSLLAFFNSPGQQQPHIQ